MLGSIYRDIVYQIAIEDNASCSSNYCTCLGSLGSSASARGAKASKVSAAVAGICISIAYSIAIEDNASCSSKYCTCLGSLGSSASRKIVLWYHSARGAKAGKVTAVVAGIYTYSLAIRENANGISKCCTCLGSLGSSATTKINLSCWCIAQRAQASTVVSTVASIYVSIVYSIDIRGNASGSSKIFTCLGSLGTSASRKINLLCCCIAQGA